MTTAERFWAKVAKGDGCWEWTGTRRPDGYGIARAEGRLVRAHRLAWEMENGPIPAGQHVCHHCDNPPCVRPDHLFLGSQRENLADMTAKARRRHGVSDQRGAKNGYAKLTTEQVAHIKGMAAAGHYHDDIAAQYGITRANVSYITRRTWPGVEPIPYPSATRDRRLGRPPGLTPEQQAEARHRYTGQRGEMTRLARDYGVSLPTMYRYLTR